MEDSRKMKECSSRMMKDQKGGGKTREGTRKRFEGKMSFLIDRSIYR